jgi:anti-repressor protein
MNADGVVELNLEDVSRGLGFTQTQIKTGKEYVSIRWERISGYLAEFGFPPLVGENDLPDFIPENIFYKLCFKASNETARKFQDLVTDEILPSIRKQTIKAQGDDGMNNLAVFDYENHKVRAVLVNEEPWWVLKDVCEVLGLSNPSMVSDRLDDDEKQKVNPKSSLGSRSNELVTIVSESGLYNVILRSDKPEAKRFRKWVTHEILPSIHKTGMYATPEAAEAILNDPGFLIRALEEIMTIRAKNSALTETVSTQNKQIEADKGKVLFAESVSGSHTCILVGEMAKILKQNGLNLGQNRFYQWLRDHGYLIRRKGSDWNMPTQQSMELGLFAIRETTIAHSDGRTSIHKTPMVTGKGQLYFVEKLGAESWAGLTTVIGGKPHAADEN